MSKANLRAKEITKTLDNIEQGDDSDDELEDVDGLKAELDQIKKANKARQDKLDDYEKKKKWNVDNMCHVVEERTIVNPKASEVKFSDSGFALPDYHDETIKKVTEKVTAMKTSNSSTKSPNTKPKMNKSKATSITKTTSDSSKTKTRPNSSPGPIPSHEPVAMLTYHEFTEKYADVCEEFMGISSLDKTKDFLIQNGEVMLQENASNYLLLASLEDEMNGFRDKMKLTARQSQIISNIAELAKTLKSHPGNVIIPFFRRLEEREHLVGFMEGVNNFVANIIKRAVTKRKEIDDERAKEQAMQKDSSEGHEIDLHEVPKEERLGPGGLDPVEVFESLPKTMQEAFESRDTDKLKEALLSLEPKDAEMYMKRCVDSGLWNEG